MPDTERHDTPSGEIRRHAEWMERKAPSFDPAALRARAEQEAKTHLRPFVIPANRSSGRARWQFLVAAAAVVLLFASGFVVARRSPAGDSLAPPSGPSQDVPGWDDLPSYSPPPGTELADAADRPVVWTGHELLYVGALTSPAPSSGETAKDPYAKLVTMAGVPALNVGTRTWRTTSAPPVALYAGDLRAVWTGTWLIVIGRPPTVEASRATVLAYDPATDAWQTMTSAPAGGIGPVVWTGRWVLTWSYKRGINRFDPVSQSWDVLTNESDAATSPPANAPTVNDSAARAVWTGTEMVVVSGDSPAASAFDPATLAWRRLPDPPFAAPSAQIAWTGEVVGIGDARRIAWLNPNDHTVWHEADGVEDLATRSTVPAGAWLPGLYVSWAPSLAAPRSTDVAVRYVSGDRWRSGTIVRPPGSLTRFTSGIVAGERLVTWSIDGADPSGANPRTIHAASAATSVLISAAGSGPASGSAPPGSAVPAPLVPPAGVAVEDLERRGMGFDETDPRFQFAPYAPADQVLMVIVKADAIGRAGAALAPYGATPTGNEPATLGRFVERDSDGNFTSTPAWWIANIDVRGAHVMRPCAPPRVPCNVQEFLATSHGGMVVIDARSGAVLMLVVNPERGG
jgi:hypothetical protein